MKTESLASIVDSVFEQRQTSAQACTYVLKNWHKQE